MSQLNTICGGVGMHLEDPILSSSNSNYFSLNPEDSTYKCLFTEMVDLLDATKLDSSIERSCGLQDLMWDNFTAGLRSTKATGKLNISFNVSHVDFLNIIFLPFPNNRGPPAL